MSADAKYSDFIAAKAITAQPCASELRVANAALIASNATLSRQRNEASAELKLRKEDIAHQWCVNTDLKRELQQATDRVSDLEAQNERDAWAISPAMAQARINQLAADLARVTAERDHLKSLVFDGDLNFSNLTDEYETPRAESPACQNATNGGQISSESGTPAKHPDTERMDWLAGTTNGVSFAFGSGKPIVSQGAAFPQFTGEDLRSAIDAARKQGGAT